MIIKELLNKKLYLAIEKVPKLVQERLGHALLNLVELRASNIQDDEENYKWYKRHAHGWKAMESESVVKTLMGVEERSWFLLSATPDQRRAWIKLFMRIGDSDLADIGAVFDQDHFPQAIEEHKNQGLTVDLFAKYNYKNLNACRQQFFAAYKQATINFSRSWREDPSFNRNIQIATALASYASTYSGDRMKFIKDYEQIISNTS